MSPILHYQELRDAALDTADALEGLLLNITQPATQSLLRNCVWALSNMCRGKPQPQLEVLAPALPVLLTLLSSDDNEVPLFNIKVYFVTVKFPSSDTLFVLLSTDHQNRLDHPFASFYPNFTGLRVILILRSCFV